jgi:hypothetical protein
MSGISRRFFGIMACAALGCLVSGALVRGDTSSSATGTITGVVSAGGSGVGGVKVMLLAPRHRPDGNPPTTQPAPQDAPAGGQGGPGDQGGQGGAGGQGHHARPKPIAETTTASDGTYSFTNVTPGEYAVVAMLKGTGMGHGKATVTAGVTVTVNLTLEKHQRGGQGGQGQNPPPPPAN